MLYIYCDGEQKDIVRAFKKREYIDSEIKLLPYKTGMNIGDIVIDKSTIDKIVSYFKKIKL